LDYTAGNNLGGVVIRANVVEIALPEFEKLQGPNPAIGDPGFNKMGIAFYPSSDWNSMVVQVTGVEANDYPYAQINVPKPDGVANLNTRYTLRIEDHESTIYVYYDGSPYIRIDLSNLQDGKYTSGTVYNSAMDEVGTFSGIEVDAGGRVSVAQRNASLRLHSVSVLENEIVTSVNNASANAVNIFPNPAVSNVTISSSSAIKAISIADISGKVVYNKAGLDKTQLTLSVNEYQPGMYILWLETDKGTDVHKLVIQK